MGSPKPNVTRRDLQAARLDLEACHRLARKQAEHQMPIWQRVKLDRAVQEAHAYETPAGFSPERESSLRRRVDALSTRARDLDRERQAVEQEQMVRLQAGSRSDALDAQIQLLQDQAEKAWKLASSAKERIKDGAAMPPSFKRLSVPGQALVDLEGRLEDCLPHYIEPPDDVDHAPVRQRLSLNPASSSTGHPISLFLNCPLGGCWACAEPARRLLDKALDGDAERPTVSLDAAAERLGVTKSTISKMAKRGDLEARRDAAGRAEAIYLDSLVPWQKEQQRREDAESDEHDRRQLERMRREDRR